MAEEEADRPFLEEIAREVDAAPNAVRRHLDLDGQVEARTALAPFVALH